MKIAPPLGYEQITPLLKSHRVVLPHGGELPAIFHRLHAIPLSLAEFGPTCRDYPIVFVSNDDGGTFNAVAVLGLQAKQNLFILTDGMWDRRTYIPAYVRRYPFCIAKVTLDGEPQKERIVCVEKSALSDSGDLLYDKTGRALPEWRTLEKLVFDYEADLQRCEEMCKLLVELQLLEPFSMKAEVDGFTLQLEGMHRVARETLESLREGRLRRLLGGGVMEKIYAHLLSLDNFRRLLHRRSFFAVRPPAEPREFN